MFSTVLGILSGLGLFVLSQSTLPPPTLIIAAYFIGVIGMLVISIREIQS